MPLPDRYFKASMIIRSPQKSQFVNVFWYEPDAVTSGTSDSVIAINFSTNVLARLSNAIAGILTPGDFDAALYGEWHNLGVVWAHTAALVTVGTVLGDQCPDFTAVVAQKRTVFPGKSGRGRWYIGPVPEAFSDENLVEGGADAAYNAVLSDWISTIAVADPACNLVPKLHSVKDADLKDLTAATLNRKLGTQLGRKFRSIA